MSLPRMRALVLLCLCALVAAPARAVPAAAAANAEPLTWPDRGPYQKVGRPDGVLGTLKMPAPVVAAVQRRVSGDPSIWGLYPVEQYPGQQKRIINVASRAGGYLSLLAAHGTWTILDIPTVNEVLDPLVPADLQNHAKLALYFVHVVQLLKYNGVAFLDSEFRRARARGTEEGMQEWLQGNEKRRSALLALCREWEVTRSQDCVSIGFNVLTPAGGVEHWTFHLRVNQAVQLGGIKTRPVRKNGTFSCPLAA